MIPNVAFGVWYSPAGANRRRAASFRPRSIHRVVIIAVGESRTRWTRSIVKNRNRHPVESCPSTLLIGIRSNRVIPERRRRRRRRISTNKRRATRESPPGDNDDDDDGDKDEDDNDGDQDDDDDDDDDCEDEDEDDDKTTVSREPYIIKRGDHREPVPFAVRVRHRTVRDDATASTTTSMSYRDRVRVQRRKSITSRLNLHHRHRR